MPYRILCENCRKLRRDEQKRSDEIQRKEREWARRLARKAEQLSMKTCPICGSLFVGKRNYCSEACRNRNRWAMKDGYRYLFPLVEVYERDNGICYICGERCDWNDFNIKDDIKIYGNKYPSRDHIVPKSRGGANEWENIRLACRGCNSKKGSAPMVKNI